MKQYTIGALFSTECVLLIHKLKPEWQRGYCNFPGGHVELGELPHDCIVREFKEETNLYIPKWDHIGRIENEDTDYSVDFFTAKYHYSAHGMAKSMTEENIFWRDYNNLPLNCISNLYWLVPFALNFHNQGNADKLNFGVFSYKYVLDQTKGKMTFVILQAPNNGYYWLLKATCDRHFECLDKGFVELKNGSYEDMRELLGYLEWCDTTKNGTLQCITLKNKMSGGYTYYTDEELKGMLAVNPLFFEDYEIVDNHNWFGKY
jgi:8-oxo-dGTP pyrophosphatase MutT (NUDIX family)